MRIGTNRQSSSVESMLSLLVALGAAVIVGGKVASWASSVIDLPAPNTLLTGMTQQPPQRPHVGATPAPKASSACASFNEEFSALAQAIGGTMGEPMECAHDDPATGDTLQQTSTGLAILRRHSGAATFTDGYRRWAVDTRGVITWEGEAMDPPRAAR
jgi:hypothetical protein